jgi:hypothetical protein
MLQEIILSDNIENKPETKNTAEKENATVKTKFHIWLPNRK